MKKIAVIGFGISGQAIVRFLSTVVGQKEKAENLPNEIHVFDSKSSESVDSEVLANFTNNSNIEFHFETNDFDVTEFDEIVISPGVPMKIPVLQRAIENKIPIKNDVTLFIEKWRSISHFRENNPNSGKIIGVTGSNGKSTVVSLLHEYLKGIGENVILAGNIGNSPLDIFDKDFGSGSKIEESIIILELSSFQLEAFRKEHFLDICVITNISSNHLDRYENNIKLYAQAKMKGIDYFKTNVVVWGPDSGNQKYIIPEINLDNLIQTDYDILESTFPDTENRKLIGQHNLQNIAMVYSVLDLLRVDSSHDEIIREFTGLEHRLEFVSEIGGVKYINDSKSTSPEALRVALEAVNENLSIKNDSLKNNDENSTDQKNVILITGGVDKDMDFEYLEHQFSNLKQVILLPGTISEKITKISEKVNVPIKKVDDMNQAVEFAKTVSVVGDTVLLSPGSGSHNLYKNFEERGKDFKNIVKKKR
jgi:UDP-N-acetylmuramoylalanine--D-glutamate ligase